MAYYLSDMKLFHELFGNMRHFYREGKWSLMGFHDLEDGASAISTQVHLLLLEGEVDLKLKRQ